MPLLEGRETSSEQGYQLECRLCEGRSAVYLGRDEAALVGRRMGWDVGSRGILCHACTRRKTRYEVLSDADP